MMLRLVLVGMVAALGVTIPGGTNRAMVGLSRPGDGATRSWWIGTRGGRIITPIRHGESQRLGTNASNAGWRERRLHCASEAQRLAPEWPNRHEVHGDPNGELALKNQPLRVIVFVPADSLRAPTLAFEPIEVGDDFYTGVAFELNRNAEGINLVQAATAPTATLARSQPVALAESLEPDLPAVLCGVTDEDAVDLPPIGGHWSAAQGKRADREWRSRFDRDRR